MVMSPSRIENSVSMKQKRIFGCDSIDLLPESKRQKVKNIKRTFTKNGCGVGEVCNEDDTSQTFSNNSEKMGSEINKTLLDKPSDYSVLGNGFYSDCNLPNTKGESELETLVGSRPIDSEPVKWWCEKGCEIVHEIEEGEIVEDAVDENADAEIGNDMVIAKNGEQSPCNRSASSREVEEGDILEEDIVDFAEASSGEGALVEKDNLVDEMETKVNSQIMVYDNDHNIKTKDNTMRDSDKWLVCKSIGDVTGSVICSQEPKSAAKKQENRVSNSASTIAAISRSGDDSTNLAVKPKRNVVSKMNVAKRKTGKSKGAAFDGDKLGADDLADKEFNEMSIVTCASQETPIRSKVKETLNMFQQVLQNLLQSKQKVSQYTYVEAAMQLKKQGKWVNMDERIIGAVPGVEVGDKYHCRAELVIIGLHHPFAAGIDSMEVDGKKIAISIVASGRYANETEFTDVLIYSGEGGNPAIKDRELKDQTLERGNLALKNSMDAKSPVRVIRGFRAWKPFRAGDRKREKEATFIYDGLYVVSGYWQERGRHGNLIFMFRLDKLKGQPKLVSNSVSTISENLQISRSLAVSPLSSNSRKCKRLLGKIERTKSLNLPVNLKTPGTVGKSEVHRNPILVEDISCGKEKIAIRLVNDIDDVKPPVFNYIANMVYPHLQYSSIKTSGCQCVNGCSDCVKCYCVKKNRGSVPFNDHGAIIRQKRIIYECGPSCKCPPSCNNRVSQLGLKFQLEVFKTELRGWALRSRDFISSGSFICEYVGELLEDMQAEQRTDCDEYLFNLGDNNAFTIDAAIYGNVGRFLNHSCSPNLYAQNVLFDHGDKRMPHVMLFATRDIPPLQELTFDYNYEIGQVFDVNGDVKKKNCCCGADDCRGRMY